MELLRIGLTQRDMDEPLRTLLEGWRPVAGQAIAAMAFGLLAFELLLRILKRMYSARPVAASVLSGSLQTLRIFFLFCVLQLVLRAVDTPLPGIVAIRHGISLVLIGACAVLSLRVVSSLAAEMTRKHRFDVPDNLRARRLHTQVAVLSGVAKFLILLIATAAIFMTFPALRSIGTSLLASAGIAGVAAGFAAKPILGNLLAGLQIAFTQPIRLDDVVIINGEWGKIAEITSAYVVVKIWDERSLIVPLQWFIENPFQNWTRTNADLLGTVTIWLDYAIPVDPLRKEALRICSESREWDRRVCIAQVTDASERAMQIRFLVSAGNASDAFDLRCVLREGILKFVREEFQDYLPRTRLAVADSGPGGETANGISPNPR